MKICPRCLRKCLEEEDVLNAMSHIGKKISICSICGQEQGKVGMSVGKCQQAQVELMRMLDFHGFKYELHKPQKGNWAKNKPLFEKATGWTARSNEDGRSASYFGYLALADRQRNLSL